MGVETIIKNRIYLIDGHDFELPERTGTYVIQEEDVTLVETGPSISVPHIRKGLQDLKIELTEIKYIILTHIHLDHAGGVGLLLKDCPNATVVVHPRGARHLVDPSRLIQGARAIYKDDFDRLYDPILPVPEKNVIVKEDGETLKISSCCTLTFYDTPGHSNHHFSIYDPVSNGMFTGDTAGISYNYILNDHRLQFYLPSTTPNQFNPDKMEDSLERFEKMNLDYIYFGHYSYTNKVDEVFQQVRYWLPQFVATGERAEQLGKDDKWIADELFKLIQAYLGKQGVPDNHRIYDYIKIDMFVNSLGLVDYFTKKKA